MQPSPSSQRSAPDPTSHPEVDTWIAYHGGELPEVEERRLRSHLTSCRRCVQLLLDLDGFVNDPAHHQPANGERTADFERAATWRLVQASHNAATAPTRRHPQRSWRSWRSTVAAVAATVLLALSGWTVLHQQGELQELRTSLSSPQANAPIFDLRPGGSLRSLKSPAQRLEVPAGSGFTLIINLIEAGSWATYRARIVDPQNTEVTSVEGLKLDRLDTLTLLMPSRVLPPGLYAVELRGDGQQAETPPLESYSIEIVRP